MRSPTNHDCGENYLQQVTHVIFYKTMEVHRKLTAHFHKILRSKVSTPTCSSSEFLQIFTNYNYISLKKLTKVHKNNLNADVARLKVFNRMNVNAIYPETEMHLIFEKT